MLIELIMLSSVLIFMIIDGFIKPHGWDAMPKLDLTMGCQIDQLRRPIDIHLPLTIRP